MRLSRELRTWFGCFACSLCSAFLDGLPAGECGLQCFVISHDRLPSAVVVDASVYGAPGAPVKGFRGQARKQLHIGALFPGGWHG